MSSMSRPFSLGPWLLHRLPRNRTLARVTRAYLSWYRSDNNVWADSNGEFDLLRAIAPSCRVVLDIGANVGDWSREALKANPALSIHCFEAAPDNYATLAEAGLGARVVLNHAAVSNRDGEIELVLFGSNSPLNSTVTPPTAVGSAGRKVVVRATKIDSYLAEHRPGHVDLVKIDVEGAELHVLEGMAQTLASGGVDAVQFEYGPFSIYARTFMKDFFDLFHAHGFEMFKISSPRLLRFANYTETMDNFSHQNWLAVRGASDLMSVVEPLSVPGQSL